MSIREEARQAAQEYTQRHIGGMQPVETIGDRVRGAFLAGAVWASERADREPSEAYVTILAREFERIWNERVETFDPEVHDETPFIEGIMRDALIAAQEVRRG